MATTNMTISISKFEVEGKVLYAKVYFEKNYKDVFHLKLYDGDTSWSGYFTKESENQYRDRVDLSEEEYEEEIKFALSGQSHKFSYDVKLAQGGDLCIFSWFKKIQNGLIVYGSVTLQRDSSVDSKDSLIDLLLLQNKNLQNTVVNMTTENEEISKDLEKCKFQLENFVNIKSSLEESLYGKFAQLLNSKKRRIEVLEENILKFGDSTKKGE